MARVHNGHEWLEVFHVANSGSTVPISPAKDLDGSIFVSIASFRDGQRCAKTIQSLFENAKEPDKVIVGLIEQNAPEDDFCIETYCSLYGAGKFLKRHKIRADTTKVMIDNNKGQQTKCPYYDQIRLVAEHNIAAKGPVDARALGRKILGNEEYCMQIDAHTTFTKDWDSKVKQEWKGAENEFAIISTVPASIQDQEEYEEGGDYYGQVPRQCIVKYDGADIPSYALPADGKVTGLQKPMLSHAWSAGFAFAKCHLEESAPYDPFAPYILGAEQFPRFARFWTRGYDVYTPTQNIVFHDYEDNADGHGKKEWMKKRRERLRKESLDRFRTFLGIGTVDQSARAQANLGLYGLGKRRTLQQLNKFVGIDLSIQLGNRKNTKCADHTWVPYDESISPMDHLHSNADDLDPQPEYPLRTKHVYYQQAKMVPPLSLQDVGMTTTHHQDEEKPLQAAAPPPANGPPMGLLWTLWVIGLIAWCAVYIRPGNGPKSLKRRRKGLTGKDV